MESLDESASSAGGLFTGGQARVLSAALLRYMLEMKHNGAVENVQAGFVALAARCAHAGPAADGQRPDLWPPLCSSMMIRTTCPKPGVMCLL